MKEKLVYIGQLDTYERDSQIAERLLGIETNDTAIYRLTDETGAACAEMLEKQQVINHSESEKTKPTIAVEVDGSFILTRKEEWKEVKLGRIFEHFTEGNPASAIDNQLVIDGSEYVSHFGGHIPFKAKMDKLLRPHKGGKSNLLFINDGATWIENWINTTYPEALHILDFYHAMKHISDYLEIQYESKEEKQNMVEYWGHLLKKEGPESIKKHLEKEAAKSEEQKAAKEKLEEYLEDNEYRMQYPQYISQGYMIGSGAVESAHKTVIQRRMKLAGQRWSRRGAQNMLNLRCVTLSNHWQWIEEYFRNAA